MIKRRLLADLVKHLSAREISFLVGPRQSGKTTLMLLLKKRVEIMGKKSVFLNLDIEADKQFFLSQEQLLRKVSLEIGQGGYVFIDEIQRKENAGLFLKGLYDMNLPYKFIVSGSGSVELKERLHESLAGRKRVFELSTLSFIEFVNYRTDYRYEGKLAEYFALEPERVKRLFDEYLSFGGYPRVVLGETLEEKRKIIGELYQSYLERDVSYLLAVRKTESFTSLVRLMASQIGHLVSSTELSATLGISTSAVNDYLWYMQKTFLIDKVTPFFRNLRKEITKASMYYFYDLGLRNYSLGIFGATDLNPSAGFLFQNFVFHLLKAKTSNSHAQIHYWRTSDKAEVDFVVDTGEEVIPVEVKYKSLAAAAPTRSLRSFLTKYRPLKAYVIHLGAARKLKVDKTQIFFLPYHQFISRPL